MAIVAPVKMSVPLALVWALGSFLRKSGMMCWEKLNTEILGKRQRATQATQATQTERHSHPRLEIVSELLFRSFEKLARCESKVGVDDADVDYCIRPLGLEGLSDGISFTSTNLPDSCSRPWPKGDIQ